MPTTLALVTIPLFSASFASAAPTPENTMEAYRIVEVWIRDWNVPPDSQAVDPPGVSAAGVTLRLEGRIVGRASASSNHADSLWQASRRAWSEANAALPVDRDALRRENLLALAPNIMIDIELAGVMTPILADSLADVSFSVSPAREGVAARIGDRLEAVFPGAMLSMNMTPGDGVMAALGALGLAPVELNKLRRDTGLILYRFSAQRLAQTRAGEPPIFLVRGARLVNTNNLTPASLRRFGDQLVTNLLRREWPGDAPLGLMGMYKPWLDRYEEPTTGEPLDQALAALAILRYARVLDEADPQRTMLLAGARRVLDQLAEAAPGEKSIGPDNAVSSLSTLANIFDSRLNTPDVVDPARNNPPLPAAMSPPAALTQQAPTDAPPQVRAIMALLYAELARGNQIPGMAELARGEVRALFSHTEPAELPTLMPWLGWAELALLTPQAPIPSGVALREFRRIVEQHQITGRDIDAAGDDDLLGGVVFTRSATPLPTWHTIRPLIFMATMIADDRLTSTAERPFHLARLLEGLRFVRQLTIGEDVCGLYPNCPQALGGVRLALWDQRQPIEPTAMALLLVAETLDAVSRITEAPE